MIISMKLHSTKEEIEQVCERIRDFGYKIHAIQGEERVVIAAVGVGDVTACLESIEAMPQVESAVRISAPYKFVSREFQAGKSRVRVDGHEIVIVQIHSPGADFSQQSHGVDWRQRRAHGVTERIATAIADRP